MAPTSVKLKSDFSSKIASDSALPKRCFLCLVECDDECPRCHLVHYCCKEHGQFHVNPEVSYQYNWL